ncbi:glycosyl hydrolase family 2 [Bacteroidia bacterium]|nr:glycosyl hydrolase family 2 [Bacteroidia bacterium]
MITAGVPLLQGCVLSNNKEVRDELFELFRNPPVTSKPFVRWWWNGDKLSAKEILRELDIMKEAGIGGVEINPIAFPGGDDLGISSLTWLSPEWIEMVKVALKGADERGIICDIIVGSGWPFGGEFLQPEEQTQLLTLAGKKVKGPGKILLKVEDFLKEASPEVGFKFQGASSEIYSICLAPVEMNVFSPAQPVPYEKGSETFTVEVPEGEYIVYALVKVTGFQSVINGAPGAAGPVLNHYNGEAVQKFLNRMSDNLFPAIKDLKGFRAMFCDSMELEGANWCYDFPEEFKRRRGYDVEPFLPFLLYKVGHMGHAVEGTVATVLTGEAKEAVARVRYDFFVTCMDIMRDRFLIPYTEWCHQHHFKSRMQAYGREFHPLEASLQVDIPECETWLWSSDSEKERDFSRRPTYTNVNKFVASAAHYTGKKIVSCEEVTNTDNVFNATLERIKVLGDQSNLSGVNHSILHGFNYSPAEVPFPGWIRYGTFFNERNPWWPFFKLWAAYKARLSTIFQETDYFADIAVMHPLADMWTKYGPQRDPFPGLLYPEYQYKVWEAIHQNGNSCDYISEDILRQSKFEKGFLTYNSRKYHTLILLEVESILPDTAKALSEFVKNGGKLIFVAKEPCQSPGWKDHKAHDEAVKQTIDAMKQANPPHLYQVAAPGKDMIEWFKAVQQQCDIRPYLQIDAPSPYVSQNRYRTKDKDFFFIVNYNTNERITLNVKFPEAGNRQPWIWDAETGEKYPCPATSEQTLNVDLYPATSRLIVFEKTGKQEASAAVPAENASGVELNGWKLRMEHLNGKSEEGEMNILTDLADDPKTQSFAGHLFYTKQIEDNAASNYLDLGRVYGVSEVTVNGESLGCKWYGRHLYQLPEHIAKTTDKIIQVKISTTVGNYLKSTPDNETGQRWTRHQKWQPVGMIGPVRLIF